MFNGQLLGERIKKIRGKKSQDIFANEIGISRGALSYYENGEREPDAEIIYKICESGNVSADYLLGFTDNPTTDPDLKAICEYTGLNEKSINKLNVDFNYRPDIFQILNQLIIDDYIWDIISTLRILEEISMEMLNSAGLMSDEDYTNALFKCDINRYEMVKIAEKLSNLFDHRKPESR